VEGVDNVMIKVIETNLSVDGENTIKDHQSRVIGIDSWDKYIQEIKDAKAVYRSSIIGSLHGNTIQSDSKVKNLIYDEFHLSCDVYNRFGIMSKKLAYKL
jgi:hypothetical protein